MNSYLNLIAFAAFFVISPLNTRAQTTTSLPAQTELAAIRSYTTTLDAYIKLNPRHRIFGDVSSAINDSRSRWREFRSEAELEKAATGENLNRSALVWARRGKIVGANFTFTSPSGDWAHLIMYYFREDGSLAKIQAQLNTFYGDLSVVRERYFDSNGKLLKSTRKFLDLETQKPKKPGEFFDNPVPVYRKVSELPFRKLL